MNSNSSFSGPIISLNVSLTVHERISVRATGGSMQYYKGNGTVEVQELSGGSQVIKAE